MTDKVRYRPQDVRATRGLEDPVGDDRGRIGGISLGEGFDEAVRILSELTCDFERFDSMISDQRNMLAHPAGRLRRGADIDRQSQRFRLETADMAVRTQKALEQLSRLAEPVKPRLSRDPVRGLARERRTG